MTTPEIQASLASYDVALLMMQTRKLAADYRQQTGQALPVTEELARFDAVTILGLDKVEDQDGIDAVDKPIVDAHSQNTEHLAEQVIDRYLIKGRVIFKGGKARQKLGKLALQANWTYLLMVIYDADYMPSQIVSVKRTIIDKEMQSLAQDKRGSMTVAKYKAIGNLEWSAPIEKPTDIVIDLAKDKESDKSKKRQTTLSNNKQLPDTKSEKL